MKHDIAAAPDRANVAGAAAFWYGGKAYSLSRACEFTGDRGAVAVRIRKRSVCRVLATEGGTARLSRGGRGVLNEIARDREPAATASEEGRRRNSKRLREGKELVGWYDGGVRRRALEQGARTSENIMQDTCI